MTRLKEMEKREILAALERNRWIQSQAAMDLGLTLRQIGYRVKQFGLEKLIKEQRGQAVGIEKFMRDTREKRNRAGKG